jgi:cyclin D1/2/4
MTQLLSVACLSLAAKMEETYVPPSLDLQVRTQCRRIYYAHAFKWTLHLWNASQCGGLIRNVVPDHALDPVCVRSGTHGTCSRRRRSRGWSS